LQTLGLENSYDIFVNVFGGGLTGQADAIKQGAARALCELSLDNRKPLKTEGHLSRDPRAKERRKYGLKKARKATQISKRKRNLKHAQIRNTPKMVSRCKSYL